MTRKIAVLMGGWSAEREVSLKSGRAVAEALRARGHDVHEVDLISENIRPVIDLRPEVAFIALHGRFGEDGGIQSLLEEAGIPYTGSDAQASREKAAKLIQDAHLFELAACQYETQTRTPKDAELTLYAETVADVLERHLGAESSVHWVRAVGEESSWGPSRTAWPSNPVLIYQVQQGVSEGTQVHVMMQLDPKDPAAVRHLLTVKLLTAGAKAYEEVAMISAFLDKLDTNDLLAAQVRTWKRVA